ncbi:MAG: hypothetical protein ACYTF1_04220 [Planctomycetota bacterium]|jgi:hypothetical protein
MDKPTVKMKWNDADFEKMSWHDNCIHGFHFYSEEWTSDLILDIDYIVEWVCGVDKICKFWISPATLTFHDVTDLKINVDWGDSGMQTILHEMYIYDIQREKVKDQKICLDQNYYRWTIQIDVPMSGDGITFGATGFTQILRDEPILADDQFLPPSKRPKLFG